MALNFNVDPYFDDFDSTKNFHRVLYKPGVAVQARELTQSQSILQDQISKFGLGVYADGSKVTGGSIFVDANITTVKIQPNENIENFVGLFAVGQTSKFIGEVIKVDSNNHYVVTKPVNVQNNSLFSSAEDIYFFETKLEALASLNSSVTQLYSATSLTESTLIRNGSGTYLNNVITINTSGISVGDIIISSTGSANTVYSVIAINSLNSLTVNKSLQSDFTNSSLTITNKTSVKSLEVGVEDGVWFTNGFFVANYLETIVPDYLNMYPSVVVGFEVDETIIDYYDDSTLLDPAIGASNYQAPGADRYKISLNLVTKPYVSDQTVADLTTNKFIELIRIYQGVVQNIRDTPIFTEISKSIARAVSDQSGDFVVNPYSLNIADSTSSQNTFNTTISSGKIYIEGYAVQHIAPTQYQLQKARDTSSDTNQDIASYYGNYSDIKNIKGSIVNFQTGTQVQLHNVATSSANSNTVIGSARVRNFSYDSGSANNCVYKSFLFDVQLANNSFANVSSMIIPGASNNYTSVSFSANTVSNTNLVDSNYSSLIFPIGYKNIANVTNINYVTTRLFDAASFVNGVYTITTNGANEDFVGGTGVISSAEAKINYMVVTTSASGMYPTGLFVPMDQSNVSVSITNSSVSAGQATFNIGGNFSGTAKILATISVTSDTIKSKVLNSNTAVEISANTSGVALDIGKSDVFKYRGIYEMANNFTYLGTWNSGTTYSANSVVQYDDGRIYTALVGSNTNQKPNTATSYWTTTTNKLTSYTTDNGQKDEYYDHGTITNTSGVAKGNVVVLFDYFTHSGGTGFFTVDSYAAISYADIPSFTSPQYGTSYSLRDVLDFRPRRTDGIGTTTFDSSQIPAPFNNPFVNYSYYLNRIDKIVVQKNGQFKTIKGVSSYLIPAEPVDMPGALTLFTINYPAYTFTKNDISVTPTNLRRYTMKDIGVLDKRITNIEYYTALSVLESQVTGQDVTDSTGQNLLFKNGFLVDSFKGQGVADVENTDYKTSIDVINQIARPTFTSNVANYFNDLTQGAYVTSPGNKTNNYLSVKNNIVTFSYNDSILVNQNVATEIVNVNPFNVINFTGSARTTPASDIWHDTDTQPSINIVNEDQSAWIAAVNNNGYGTQWNDWQINWTGQNIVSSGDQTQLTRDTQAISNLIVAKGLTGALNNGNITVSSSTQILSSAIIPYARSIPITLEVFGMPPFTKLHTYVNRSLADFCVSPLPGSTDGVWNIKINNGGTGYTNGNNQSIIVVEGANTIPAIAYANVAGGSIVEVNIQQIGEGYTTIPTIRVTGSNTSSAVLSVDTANTTQGQLITNKNGYAAGILSFPSSNTGIKIPTGSVLIEVTDNIVSPATAKAYATTTFYSQGTLDTIQTTTVSTRPPTYSLKQTYVNPVSGGGTPIYNPGGGGGPLPDVNWTPTSFNPATAYDTKTNGFNLAAQGAADLLHNQYSTMPNFNQNLSNSIDNLVNNTTTLNAIYDAFNSSGTPPSVEQMQQALINYVVKDASSSSTSSSSALNSTISSITTASSSTSTGKNGTTGCSVDPLCQNFFVSDVQYPKGIFLSSVDLFFASKDTSIPVSIRIRPTVNGYPDAVNDIPGSIVYKDPDNVIIPSSGNIEKSIGLPTNFVFDYPIYLAPGQYSLMVVSDSNNYNVYASKQGQVQYGTQNTVKSVSYAGSFFKSQNASTWIPAAGETMCFKINICDFAGGSQTFAVKSNSSTQFDFDLMQLTNRDLEFGSDSDITYQVSTKDLDLGTKSTVSIIPNQNHNFSTRKTKQAFDDIRINATMSNTDRWTSPVIDLERLNTILVQNIVTPYASANTTSESLAGFGNGGSSARYITRRITLANNFDSTGLTVYVDVNRQPGTKIEVYYKVMNAHDNNSFDNQPYHLMSPIFTPGGSLAYTGATDWTEDTYQATNISYNDVTTGSLYNNFKVFAVKICMYSDNPAIVPQLKKLRVIATA